MSNEAAERLREWIRDEVDPTAPVQEAYGYLDAALAHERSAGAAPLTLAGLDRLAEPLHARIITREAMETMTRLAYEKGLSERSAGAAPLLAQAIELAERYHSEHSVAGSPCKCDLCRECKCDLCRELRVIRRYAEGTDR